MAEYCCLTVFANACKQQQEVAHTGFMLPLTLTLVGEIGLIISVANLHFKSILQLKMKSSYSPCPEEIGARASVRTCTLFARVIQDLRIRKREFLVPETCRIFHLG